MERGRFRTVLIALLGLYLAIELVYVHRLPLAMDEFQFASEIVRYQTPYRDFVPYKNLLGYSLQSISFALGRVLGLSPWSNLILLKSMLAVAVAASIGLAGWRMRRWFEERAILAATALLVPMSTFLERSAVLRVDMLASLFGLAAVMAAMGGAWTIAGGFVGVAFLVTQKAAYFFVSLGGVLAFDALCRRDAKEAARQGLRFVSCACAPVLVYLVFYSVSSSFSAVVEATFFRSAQVALWTDYADLRATFWWQTVSRNPVFYAISLGGLLALLASSWSAFVRPATTESGGARREGAGPRGRLAVHGILLLVLCALHRQPWPYFFVFLIPSAWLTSVAALEWLGTIDLGGLTESRRSIALGLLVAIGMAIPVARIPSVLDRDNAYQRNNFEVLDAILGPEESYLAGVNVLYHRPFQPAGVRWLDRRRIAEIEAQNPEERRAFLASLEGAPIKAVLRNYRTGALPEEIRDFLAERYRRVYGSISTSAPYCRPDDGVTIRFPGTYLVSLHEDQKRVNLDGRFLPPGSAVDLDPGRYPVAPPGGCRLQLVPRVSETLAESSFVKKRPFFEDVYTY